VPSGSTLEVIDEIRYAFDVLKANGVSITSSYGEGQNAGGSESPGVIRQPGNPFIPHSVSRRPRVRPDLGRIRRASSSGLPPWGSNPPGTTGPTRLPRGANRRSPPRNLQSRRIPRGLGQETKIPKHQFCLGASRREHPVPCPAGSGVIKLHGERVDSRRHPG